MSRPQELSNQSLRAPGHTRAVHCPVDSTALSGPLFLGGRTVGVFEEEGGGVAARRRHALSWLMTCLVTPGHAFFTTDAEGVPSFDGGLSSLLPLGILGLAGPPNLLSEGKARVRFTGIVPYLQFSDKALHAPPRRR